MPSHPDPLINEAIAAAVAEHPYYWSALDRLRIVADPSVATMATSAAWVTHYNPATVASWTPAERGAVLVHELEHLLRRHHERCADRDPGRFNVAGDAEINQRLANLPDGAVYPESIGMPRGRTAEIYYGATDPQPEPEPDGGDGDGSGDGSGGDGDGSGDGAPNGSPSPGKGKPGPGTAQCGSAAGGPTQAHEAADAANPGRGANPDEADRARDDAARGILAGTEPGDERREWAERELNIDRAEWYRALCAVVGHTMSPTGAPTRWQWPGRRDMRDMGGAMVPRWTGERPSCAVVIDSSGSITPFDLELATAAAQYIARVSDVVVYACDTEPVRLGSRVPDAIPGGGGTDMGAGIAAAIADGAKLVVVITDCMTPWPAERPSVPVVIGANPGAERILDGSMARERMAKGYAIPDWMRQPPEWATVLSVVRKP